MRIELVKLHAYEVEAADVCNWAMTRAEVRRNGVASKYIERIVDPAHTYIYAYA